MAISLNIRPSSQCASEIERPHADPNQCRAVEKKKLLIMTTVSSTFENNLVSQPRFLSNSYHILICSSPSSGLVKFAQQEGVDYAAVEMYRGINIFKDLYAIFLFFRILIRFKPDIVHSYTPKAGLVNAITGFFRKQQISVHTFTGLVFLGEQGIKRKILIAIDRMIAHLVTEVIPEGNGVKHSLAKYRISQNPAPVIWHGNINGVDFQRFNPEVKYARRKERAQFLPNTSSNTIVFSFIGRINKHKGVEELIEAFRHLQSRFPEIHLLIAGKIEDKNKVHEQTLSTIHTHPHIHYFGFTRDIEKIFTIADVNILPSYREGMPNVVLQSSAMAVPSIVSHIPGCNDIVKDGVNGWTVEARNTKSLEKKMEDIINMETSDIIKTGTRAHQIVQQKFNRKDIQKKLSEYYLQLLSRHQRA